MQIWKCRASIICDIIFENLCIKVKNGVPWSLITEQLDLTSQEFDVSKMNKWICLSR